MTIRKRLWSTLFLILIITTLVACGTSKGSSGTIVIGSKNYSENIILAHIIAELIEDKTEITVDRKVNLGGSNVAWKAMMNKDIHILPDYTGTVVANYYQGETGTPEETLQKAREMLEQDGMVFLNTLGFSNTYTIAVTPETKEEYELATFSDLAKVSEELIYTSDFVSLDRPDGFPGLKDAYGFNFKDVIGMDHGISYRAITNGEVDALNAFSTDAQIMAHDLVTLEDDLGFFPPYDAGPVIHQETLDQFTELEEILNLLAGKINEETMRALNAKVDIDMISEVQVARDFLIEIGLINP